MNTKIFNNLGRSYLPVFAESLKNTYLLSRKLTLFGSVDFMITDWERLRNENMGFKKKFYVKFADKEMSELFETIFEAFKYLNQKKHLKPDEVKVKMQATKLFKEYETEFIKYMREKYQLKELTFFYDLLKLEPELLTMINPLVTNEETYDQPETFTHFLAINKLQTAGKENEIFWLEPDFYNPVHAMPYEEVQNIQELMAPKPEGSAKVLNLISFPLNLLLTALELKYLRQELEPLVISWYDAWNPLLAFYLGNSSEKPDAEKLENALVLGKEIEQKLLESKVYHEGNKLHARELFLNLELGIALMPYTLIWDFYEKQDFLEPYTKTYLDAQRNEEAFKKDVPVFIWKCNMENYYELANKRFSKEPEPEETELDKEVFTSTKKFLDID